MLNQNTGDLTEISVMTRYLQLGSGRISVISRYSIVRGLCLGFTTLFLLFWCIESKRLVIESVNYFDRFSLETTAKAAVQKSS
jgi:hypothetical protein